MAYLILSDGSIFNGVSVGVSGVALGEVVFNTSMLGYQEILTDPSYHGQMITFTTPHIGNVGINLGDYESKKIHAHGAIFRELSKYYSNWRGQQDCQQFLEQQHLVAISEIDTRALTILLREKGSQNAAIVTDNTLTPASALELARSYQFPRLKSQQSIHVYADPVPALAHVIVIDTGVKEGILNCLAEYPIKITVVPHDIAVHDLKALQPDGILLSNGPGDPESYPEVIELAQFCLKAKLPTFGICLGHQILALALGAKTKKMKFGHHGANHPIQCHETGVVFISSQNHNFVVDEDSLPSCLDITHSSLFDGTIAGLQHRSSPAFSFQGHPEASPGPRELAPLFQKFIHEVTHAKKS